MFCVQFGDKQYYNVYEISLTIEYYIVPIAIIKWAYYKIGYCLGCLIPDITRPSDINVYK